MKKVYAPIFTNIFWRTYNTLMIRWMTLHSTLSIFVTYRHAPHKKNLVPVFPLTTDYFQSQFYTGMQKAADTALNQKGGLMVSGERKDVIVAEASAHFNLRKQIIVFQDGTEVPYTRDKGIKYPYKAKASEKLYLLHVSE